MCSSAANDGRSSNVKAVRISGGGSPGVKPASTYTGRLMHFIQLMDPRHMLTTAEGLRFYQGLLEDKNRKSLTQEELRRAKGEIDACINPASGEVIPAPFRLSGYLACNIPIVATMLFTKSVYVQVLSHWVNQSLNTAVNYYNRSGSEMTAKTVAASYALAIGTACPLAFGLGKAFERAPPSLKRFAFMSSYAAVAAAGSMNVLFTRASEITGGIKVTDETGEVRGVSKKAGTMCVLQTIASRGLILPLPVVVIPAVLVSILEGRGLMPASPQARMWVQVLVITASLALALPLSIAVFPQEASFKAESLEPELRGLKLRDGSRREVVHLFSNKGL
ncbi:unnamed protein product [Ascophyllum nodosum]